MNSCSPDLLLIIQHMFVKALYEQLDEFFFIAVLKKPVANEGTCIIQSTNTRQCYMS